MYLLDINVWIAMAFNQHQNYQSARAWFDGLPAGSRCHYCRYTQMGFLRLATNPKANPKQTQTLSQAWAVYSATLLDPRVEFVAEPDGLENHWRQFTQQGSFSPHVWNDAYLAAFALAGAYEVVTFDKGFTQFTGVAITILS